MATSGDAPQPCRTCGTCPTCGNRPSPPAPPSAQWPPQVDLTYRPPTYINPVYPYINPNIIWGGRTYTAGDTSGSGFTLFPNTAAAPSVPITNPYILNVPPITTMTHHGTEKPEGA